MKTRLGITAGLLGAAIYFTGIFSGYITIVLLAGYVLIFEENEWLRWSAVKAVALLVFFSLITLFVNLIPDIIEFVGNFVAVFGGSFKLGLIDRIIAVIVSAIDIVKKILFAVLGLKALHQGSISTPRIDQLVDRHM